VRAVDTPSNMLATQDIVHIVIPSDAAADENDRWRFSSTYRSSKTNP